jgi:hypothetical protein
MTVHSTSLVLLEPDLNIKASFGRSPPQPPTVELLSSPVGYISSSAEPHHSVPVWVSCVCVQLLP